MTDPIRHMYEGLKETADALIVANQALVAAGTAIKKTVDAALQVHTDYEDVRETVHRLETIVLQQSAQIRLLTDRMNGGAQ